MLLHKLSLGRNFCSPKPETEVFNNYEMINSLIFSLIMSLAFIPSLKENPNDYIPSQTLNCY